MCAYARMRACVCVCVCMLHTDIRTYIHIYREARGVGQWPYAAELLVYMALQREIGRSRPASTGERAGRELRMSDVVEVLGPLPVFARAVGSCARKVLSCVCACVSFCVCIVWVRGWHSNTSPPSLAPPFPLLVSHQHRWRRNTGRCCWAPSPQAKARMV